MQTRVGLFLGLAKCLFGDDTRMYCGRFFSREEMCPHDRDVTAILEGDIQPHLAGPLTCSKHEEKGEKTEIHLNVCELFSA